MRTDKHTDTRTDEQTTQYFRTRTIPIHSVNEMTECKKLTQGQGHKVKGQDQICNFVKILLYYKTIHPERIIGYS